MGRAWPLEPAPETRAARPGLWKEAFTTKSRASLDLHLLQALPWDSWLVAWEAFLSVVVSAGRLDAFLWAPYLEHLLYFGLNLYR